jgi:hypothetical protein
MTVSIKLNLSKIPSRSGIDVPGTAEPDDREQDEITMASRRANTAWIWISRKAKGGPKAALTISAPRGGNGHPITRGRK